MLSAAPSIWTTSEGQTLPFICFSHYGLKQGSVEAVLAANQDLSQLGHIYPAGVRIFLPVLDEKSQTQIRLWGKVSEAPA